MIIKKYWNHKTITEYVLNISMYKDFKWSKVCTACKESTTTLWGESPVGEAEPCSLPCPLDEQQQPARVAGRRREGRVGPGYGLPAAEAINSPHFQLYRSPATPISGTAIRFHLSRKQIENCFHAQMDKLYDSINLPQRKTNSIISACYWKFIVLCFFFLILILWIIVIVGRIIHLHDCTFLYPFGSIWRKTFTSCDVLRDVT